MSRFTQMPIMHENYQPKTCIPWSVIEPHERQAKANHGGQTLERLAERGGLAPCEAVAIIEGRRWHRMDQTAAKARLAELVAAAPTQQGERSDG